MKLYHFGHTILSVPLCSIPFCPFTILSTVADPGGKSAMAPHRSCQWSLATFEGRKRNDSIVNLSKSKDFAPPNRRRLRIWPSLRKKYHIKALKH